MSPTSSAGWLALAADVRQRRRFEWSTHFNLKKVLKGRQRRPFISVMNAATTVKTTYRITFYSRFNARNETVEVEAADEIEAVHVTLGSWLDLIQIEQSSDGGRTYRNMSEAA
jgi:hypothetical protein